MDQVTQQNAAMVEQTTAASHALAREAEELGNLMVRFQVSGSRAAPAPRAVTAAAAPLRSHASPAREMQAALSRETWEEF
jgi:methyl-accepting chemotaxis protein